LDQQDEQLHGEFFEAQEAGAPLQPVAGVVEYEFAEMKFLGRKFPPGLDLRWFNDELHSKDKQLYQRLRGSAELYLSFIEPALHATAQWRISATQTGRSS
jgi:hypothetical protein